MNSSCCAQSEPDGQSLFLAPLGGLRGGPEAGLESPVLLLVLLLLDGSHGALSLQCTSFVGRFFITVRHLLWYKALLLTDCSLIRIFRIIFFLMLADICRYSL